MHDIGSGAAPREKMPDAGSKQVQMNARVITLALLVTREKDFLCRVNEVAVTGRSR